MSVGTNQLIQYLLRMLTKRSSKLAVGYGLVLLEPTLFLHKKSPSRSWGIKKSIQGSIGGCEGNSTLDCINEKLILQS